MTGGRARAWRAVTVWHLVWLLNIVVAVLVDPGAGVVEWVVSVGVVVAFVPYYLAVQHGPPRRQRHAPVVAAALAAAAMPVNAGASVLLVYAAAFAGGYRPRREAVWWFTGLTVVLVGFAAFSTVPFPWRLFAFTPALVLIWVIGLVTAEQAADERRARSRAAQVEHLATLSERERIARDLHDLLGHALTGIVVRTQLARRLVEADPQRAAAEMVAVEEAAREALGRVRETVTGWRRVDLDDEIDLARDALAAAGVVLAVERESELALAPTAESALGLALREAVTNVVRHAHATRCTVVLRQVAGRVVLDVVDDGVGGRAADGTGLSGMRERISALGGEVRREGGAGTAVHVAVPAAVAR